MDFNVITVTRQFGSLGRKIARADFYKHYTKHKFTGNTYRHLMIDSSMADFNKVASIITDTAKIKFGI